jgi:hypothetical protein
VQQPPPYRADDNRTHRAGPDNHDDCARSASDDYCTSHDLGADYDCGRTSDHISSDHDRADDNGAHGVNNGAARSEWVLAKRTSREDLRQCVLAERTGYRPGWCDCRSRREQQLP